MGRDMVTGLIDGKPINELLDMARGSELKREDLQLRPMAT